MARGSPLVVRSSPLAMLGTVGAVALAHVAPAATWLPAVRSLTPGLAGWGDQGHVALTFDDGPDPESTPVVLEALAGVGVRATFFLTVERLARWPQLGRRLVAEGHELGVHGWRHDYALWSSPRLERCVRVIREVGGVAPVWYRPPYGVLTLPSLLSARRNGLRPVLWTAWARDWEAKATPATVLARLTPGLVGGATLLLHDSSHAAAPGSWRATVDALPAIVARCRERGLAVGPLREHGLG